MGGGGRPGLRSAVDRETGGRPHVRTTQAQTRDAAGTEGVGLAVAALLVMVGVAYAAVGLTNPSFEDGLNGWTAADRP